MIKDQRGQGLPVDIPTIQKGGCLLFLEAIQEMFMEIPGVGMERRGKKLLTLGPKPVPWVIWPMIKTVTVLLCLAAGLTGPTMQMIPGNGMEQNGVRLNSNNPY